MFMAARHLLASMCVPQDRYESGDPLILFIDDFQWVDEDTIDFLKGLLEDFAVVPLWLILAERDDSEVAGDQLLAVLAGEANGRSIVLDRLPGGAVQELVSTLLDGKQVEELTNFLVAMGQGLPIRIATWINWMWDERILLPRETREWRFVADDTRLEEAKTDITLIDLIMRRVRRLPTSTRRLFSLAAVLGERFDADWLREAEGERWEVVELGLESLLERWLARRQAVFWAPVGRQNDLAHWREGARRGSFEFDHSEIRRALYDSLNPLRRQALHGDAGRSLETLHGAEEELAEVFSYHFVQAGEWQPAIHWLEVCAKRALARLCPQAARSSMELGVRICDRLARQNDLEESRRRWETERGKWEAQLASLTIS